MSGCYPKQLAGVKSVGIIDSLKTLRVSALCRLFLQCKSSYCPCPVLACVRAYFGIPIALNYKYILLGSLCYDATKLLIELLDLLVFVV